MRRGRPLFTIVLPCLLVCPCALAQQRTEPVPLAGIVRDARQEPAVDAKLGTGWWFDHARLSAYGAQNVWPAGSTREANGWQFVATDGYGRFRAMTLPRRGKVQLTIFSQDRSEAGTFVWDAGQDLSQLSLQLEPVARFRGTIVCTELDQREIPTTAYLNSFDGRRLGRFKADDGLIDLLLPAGHFSLHLYGASKQDIAARDFAFAVTAGEDARSRDIDIPAKLTSLRRGREMPPWHVTEARGIELADATIEHFRGRWLLVEVWRWNSSSPSRTTPALIEFDRKWRAANPDEAAPYAIVMLHSGDEQTLAELDTKIAAEDLREKYWGGEPLPFPLLLDAGRRTHEAWQLRWRSQTLLFDPQGRLWGEADDAEELELALAGKLPPAVPAKRQ